MRLTQPVDRIVSDQLADRLHPYRPTLLVVVVVVVVVVAAIIFLFSISNIKGIWSIDLFLDPEPKARRNKKRNYNFLPSLTNLSPCFSSWDPSIC